MKAQMKAGLGFLAIVCLLTATPALAVEVGDKAPDFTLPADGEYLIRATSLMADDTGAYTLRVARQ